MIWFSPGGMLAAVAICTVTVALIAAIIERYGR